MPTLPILFCLLFLAACSSTSNRPAATPGSLPGKPVAALRNSLLSWEDLQPTLAEAAGAVALEEVLVDRLIAERTAASGIAITPASIDAERDALARAIQGDADLPADQALAQLDRLRRTRGLGPTRFEALLLRNARLRALVRAENPQDVTPTADQLEQEARIANGDRARIRILLNPSQALCTETRDQILENSPTPEVITARFADAAVRHSTDATAAAGGLLAGVSAADPAVPEAIRQSLTTLEPGAVSPVLVTGRGFGLVLMESRTPAPRQLSADAIEKRLRTRLERLAMERLARELLTTSGVTVLDPSLAWAWENR